MEPPPSLGAFVIIAGLLAISPGADTLLVLRSVCRYGRRSGFFVVLGIATGCLVHASLSALGLSAFLLVSPLALNGLRLAGAVYLIALGSRSLRCAIRGDEPLLAEGGQIPPQHAMRDGLVTNVLNPKVAIFNLAFLPQFIDPASGVIQSYAILAGIHLALGVIWLSFVTISVDYVKGWLINERTRRVVDSAIGFALLIVGIHVVLSS